MSLSGILTCLWVVVAWLGTLRPSAKKHWPLAYAMIAAGAPIVVLSYLENGFFGAGMTVLIGAVVLRWPVVYLMRWIRTLMKGPDNGAA